MEISTTTQRLDRWWKELGAHSYDVVETKERCAGKPAGFSDSKLQLITDCDHFEAHTANVAANFSNGTNEQASLLIRPHDA